MYPARTPHPASGVLVFWRKEGGQGILLGYFAEPPNLVDSKKSQRIIGNAFPPME